MDDQKRADKKHRKLTRTPEVSQCDNSIPNVLQLSSSATTSAHPSPTSAQAGNFSAVHRNHSSSNVAALKDTSITASASSLSFSSLLSSSASFFNHHHHHHNQQNKQNNNNSNGGHPACTSASAAGATNAATSTSSALHPGLVRGEGKENVLYGEECLKSTASLSPSPNSVSPAIPITKPASTNNTISRGFEYFRGTRTNNTANKASPSDHYNAKNNYVSCTAADASDSPGRHSDGNRDASNPPKQQHQQQQHLLIKPEESLSPSSSAFSLKRFSSFSFNRGSRAKRNVAKEGRADEHHPQNHQSVRGADSPASVLLPTTSSSLSTATDSVGALKSAAADDGATSGVKAISPRRNKVSTNPFHQHSSSTSTSSSMSYQLSTDNVIDIIPACCLKVTPFQQTAATTTTTVGVAGGCARVGAAAKDSNDSTSSDGGGGAAAERSKVLSSVGGGVSFVCISCGTENRVTGVVNEARTRERLHLTAGGSSFSRGQEQAVAPVVNDATAPRASSPHTVQIQIKRNCPNQRDPSSDREDCLVSSEDFSSFMSTNPFLSDTIKRDEFLKATMRICLVVSPPATKLQVHLMLMSLYSEYSSFVFYGAATRTSCTDFICNKVLFTLAFPPAVFVYQLKVAFPKIRIGRVPFMNHDNDDDYLLGNHKSGEYQPGTFDCCGCLILFYSCF